MAIDPATFASLRAELRRFVRERLVPAEDAVERDDDIPADVVADMRQLGLFGMTVPERWGGLGLDLREEVEITGEIAWAAIAFRSLIGTNNGIGSQGIVLDGTDAQRDAWLPRLASGEVIASFCLTEPEAGSDAKSLRTRAERAAGPAGEPGWRLTGTKRFATNASRAGLFTVMARTDPDQPGARGISAFLVPAGLPGLTLGPHDIKMGQRGTRTCDVRLDGVWVPDDAVIGGEPGRGFHTAMKVLDRGRIHVAAVSCGMAARLIYEALTYAEQRRQFGKPIADFQLVQAMLADSQAEFLAARALVRETAARYDAGERVTLEAASCKYIASEMVGRVADRAVQIHGGSGYIRDFKVERFYRDARLLRLYEGTSQIQQLIIAREMRRGGAPS